MASLWASILESEKNAATPPSIKAREPGENFVQTKKHLQWNRQKIPSIRRIKHIQEIPNEPPKLCETFETRKKVSGPSLPCDRFNEIPEIVPIAEANGKLVNFVEQIAEFAYGGRVGVVKTCGIGKKLAGGLLYNPKIINSTFHRFN